MTHPVQLFIVGSATSNRVRETEKPKANLLAPLARRLVGPPPAGPPRPRAARTADPPVAVLPPRRPPGAPG